MIPANDMLNLTMKAIQEDNLSKICGYLKEDTPELIIDLDKNRSINLLFYINAVDVGPEIHWYFNNPNNRREVFSIQEKEISLICQYGKLLTFSGIKEVSLKDTNVSLEFSIPCSGCGYHPIHTKFTFTFDCDLDLWRFDIFRFKIPMKPLMSSFDILKMIAPCANEIVYFETKYPNYFGG